MTPKEKAIELINLFFLQLEESLNANINTKRKNIAKKHSIFCVDEILNIYKGHHKHPMTKYWEEVKQEIQKL